MEYICVLILFWKLHWEKEMKKLGGQLLKPLTPLKLLNTNSTNTINC